MTQKISLIISLLFISQLTFAQTNTLPTTGNVGVGTMAPTMKLEVVGDTKLDGKLEIKYEVLVKDCMTVKKKLKIEQDIKVFGKSVFDGNGKFKSDLKVLGVARMQDKLVVDGLTKMNGNAKVFGDFKIKSLENPTLTKDRLMSIDPNGKLLISNLRLAVDDMFVCSTINVAPWVYADGTTTDDDVLLCPNYKSVTIGGDFTVGGLSQFQTTGIGIAPDNQYQLNIRSVGNEAGINLFTVPATTNGQKYSFKNTINNDDIIAYSVTQNSTNDDVFRVMGDGRTRMGNKYSTRIDIGHSSLGVGPFLKSYIGFNLNYNRANDNWDVWDNPAKGSHAIVTTNSRLKFVSIPPASLGAPYIMQNAEIDQFIIMTMYNDPTPSNPSSVILGSGTRDANLYINGIAKAHEVQVRTTVWSDFVFDNNYQLTPLTEVEKYIEANKHLPDVPSKKEVLENGINLGEMDAILLQKIEELTLYMIQLKKENEELKILINQK